VRVLAQRGELGAEQLEPTPGHLRDLFLSRLS
jgi:hypothetical protein